MADGCKNAAAVNYDPDAINDDGSCVYLNKVNGVCYRWTDYPTDNISNEGFTMSYSVESKNWVFFHDYIPDYYFHTREKLHLIKSNKIYTANTGVPGQYVDNSDPMSFFVDVVFRNNDEMTLNALNWVTEVLEDGLVQEFNTLTHITIWNNYQCTGRISIEQLANDFPITNIRKTKSTWNFDDFKDIVVNRNNIIIKDIFNNYAVDVTNLDATMPWYDKKLIEDLYFIVRFEFSNSSGNVVLLHDVEADVTPSAR